MINTIFNDFSYEVLPKQKETWERYCSIMQWGRRHPTRFVEDFLNLQLTDYQKYIFMNCWTASTAVVLCSRATGKATSLDTKVYLKNKDGYPHYTTVGELKIGDKIYDGQGKLSEIIHLNPIIFDNYYLVEFDDGEKIKCNGEHLWLVHDRNFHKIGQDLNNYRLLNTDYIYHHFNRGLNYTSGDNDYTFHIPVNKPIEYAKGGSRLTIDPYVLGYYLGDGCTTSGVITCGAEDLENAIENLKRCSTVVTYRKDTCKDNIYNIKIDFEKDLRDAGYDNCKNRSLKQRLINCENLLHNKHIPEKYLFTSIENRLALLQGLMDTDGHCDTRGKCEFTQTNKQLAEDVCWLIRSLGMKATLTHKEHTGYIKKDGTESDTWRIYFAPSKEMPVFRLKRKYDRLPDHPTTVATRKAIINVTYVEEKIPMRCITMRNEDGTFLCGENFTVTHNSFFSAPFIMARSLLIPNHKSFIISVSGGQASATFSKLEDLANNNVATAIGVSSVFLDNVLRTNSKSSGFTHGKEGMHVELFNHSEVTSLNSVPDNLRGARSNLNVYDEAAFIPKELFTATLPFTAVDSNFRTAKDLNVELYPRQIPNLNLLLSSASDVSSEMFAQYKEAFRQMMLGNTSYFVADLDYHQSIAPFMNGKPMSPLVSIEEVERMYATQPYKAEREFGNKWSGDQGEDVLVKRTTLEKNSIAYYPEFKNDGTKKYILCYDPASRVDNSCVLAAELFRSEEKGLMLKLVNMQVLLEQLKGGQTAVMQKPQQIEKFKEMIVDYNLGYDDYEGLAKVYIDAGSGG